MTKDETLKGRVAEHVRALEAEVAVLLQLNHRNIVRYLGTGAWLWLGFDGSKGRNAMLALE